MRGIEHNPLHNGTALDKNLFRVADYRVAARNHLPLAPGGQHLEIIFDLLPVEKEYIIDVFDNVDFVSEQFTLRAYADNTLQIF